MKKDQENILKISLRVISGILGLLLIIFAIFPIAMSYTSIVVFLFMGVVFLVYAITGKSRLRDWVSSKGKN